MFFFGMGKYTGSVKLSCVIFAVVSFVSFVPKIALSKGLRTQSALYTIACLSILSSVMFVPNVYLFLGFPGSMAHAVSFAVVVLGYTAFHLWSPGMKSALLPYVDMYFERLDCRSPCLEKSHSDNGKTSCISHGLIWTFVFGQFYAAVLVTMFYLVRAVMTRKPAPSIITEGDHIVGEDAVDQTETGEEEGNEEEGDGETGEEEESGDGKQANNDGNGDAAEVGEAVDSELDDAVRPVPSVKGKEEHQTSASDVTLSVPDRVTLGMVGCAFLLLMAF